MSSLLTIVQRLSCREQPHLANLFALVWFALFILVPASEGFPQVNPNYHYVKPHVRSDGTFVQGHYRTNRNNTNRDNYSTQGNTNPWTGKAGWIPPDDNPIKGGNFHLNSGNSSSGGSSNENRSYQGYELKGHSIPSYNPPSYAPGIKTISYSDGEEIFVVTNNSGVRFDREKDYYAYDPNSNEIRITKGYTNGLLLNGTYRLIMKDGSLKVLAEYQNGLKHGEMTVFDDFGVVKKRYRYEHGNIVYAKSIGDDGRIHETIGRNGQPGTIEKVILDGVLVEMYIQETQSKILFSSYNPFNGKKEYDLHYNVDGSIGEITSYYPNGVSIKRKGGFANWQKTGKHLEFDENGLLVSSHTYEGDMLNGSFEYFHPNGKIAEKGFYSYNSLEGVAQSFDENGVIVRTTSFKNGLLDGKYEEYDSGRISVRGKYLEGKKTGLWERLMPDRTKSGVVQWEFHHYDQGQFDGPFKEVRFDSIIVGNYRQGLLDGDYRVYQPESMFWLGDEPQDSDLVMKGKYYKGMRTSHWEYFYQGGGLLKTGDYSLDKEHGVWKYYLPVMTEGKEPSKGLGFNGQLQLEKEYYHGQVHGRVEYFYNIREEEIPCPVESNSEDTCSNYILEKRNSRFSYHLGMPTGPFAIRDSLGRIIKEGEFLDGELHGKSIENIYSLGGLAFSHERYYLNGKLDGQNKLRDGNGNLVCSSWYHDDKPTGLWQYYRDDGKSIWKAINYFENRRQVSFFSTIGVTWLTAEYKQDYLVHFTTFDTITESKLYDYEILQCDKSNLRFRQSNYMADTIFEAEYLMKDPNCGQYEDPLITSYVFGLFIKYSSSGLLLNGMSAKILHDGTFIEKGRYTLNKKDGYWEFYYPQWGIIQIVTFRLGIPISEEYIDYRTSAPFNGTTVPFRSYDGQYQIAKIRNGKRDGLTKILDSHGNLIKRIRYDDGIELIKEVPQ